VDSRTFWDNSEIGRALADRVCKTSAHGTHAMKINFTKNEFKDLMDMVQIVQWIMNAHAVGVEEENPRFNGIEQKLYGLAKEMGLGELVEYSNELDRYHPSYRYEEANEWEEYLEVYDENSFWSKLSGKLAARDLFVKVGEQAFREMHYEERAVRLLQLEEDYDREFEENGIKNVLVKREKLAIFK
jgi:hypothetical protein